MAYWGRLLVQPTGHTQRPYHVKNGYDVLAVGIWTAALSSDLWQKGRYLTHKAANRENQLVPMNMLPGCWSYRSKLLQRATLV
jgi:hypothetical protein